jgi:outer membrane cobalamin receptor
MRHIACALVLLLGWAGASAADQQVFRGRRLEEALRLLQHRGLAIVFSSEIVKPSMRVAVEPHATTARQQLDELLAPHGLKAEAGPGRLILVVRDRSATGELHPRPPSGPRTGGTKQKTLIAEEATTYSDQVTVWGADQQPLDRGGSKTTVTTGAVRAASSVLAGDGLEAVRVMPGVVAGDDYRSEFSVRGSPDRQIGIVVDGVTTPWLQHAIYGRNDAGSLSMFASDIVDRETLQAGAYPRRYQDVLGGQLEVSLREGSRDSTRFSAKAGGTSAAVAGEGPLGNDGRGSWIAGVRNSYRTWPPKRLSANDVGFAFADAHAKLVYDMSPAQQVSVTALAGRSALETIDEPLEAPLGNGTDRAVLFTVGWRSTIGSRTVVRQRVSFVDQELVTTLTTGQLAGRSTNRTVGYRGEVLQAAFGGLLESGVDMSGVSGTRYQDTAVGPNLPEAFRARWTTNGAYANFARAAPHGLSFEGGIRVSDSMLVHERAWAPWILAAWRLKPGWIVNASAGASRQFPELDAIVGRSKSSALVPERATSVDVGIEQRVSRLSWQATLFARHEDQVLRGPQRHSTVIDKVALDPPALDGYRNSLSGDFRGVELVISSASTAPLSGWVSYSYEIARQTDISTGETFWSDFDRRHALNLAGVFRIGHQTSVGLVLRTASGVPIPGYFAETNGKLFIGDRRNDIRLAPYARLDARVERRFLSSHHGVTVFGEVLNALNRRNEGTADGIVRPLTGEAVGFSRSLLPFRASIGIEVSLRR